jgi:hypothetical protein
LDSIVEQLAAVFLSFVLGKLATPDLLGGSNPFEIKAARSGQCNRESPKKLPFFNADS